MILKTIKVLRNNWKKSVFFSCVAVYGVNYGYNKLIEHNKMRAYCEEALRFGNQYIRPDQNCRHLTVILNPMANKRKSKQNYDKYCAPLLHLAGIRVSVVVTEEEGQARDLMEIMDNTDAVLIAGGNGTVHEVVTGLLRRSDGRPGVHQYPIGILPVGRRNTIAVNVNGVRDKHLKPYELLAECTLSAIREVLKPVDVMRIEGTKGRPVFALEEFNCGRLRDTLSVADGYWYLGSYVKPYLAFAFNTLRRLTAVEGVSISYSNPCDGCSKCYQRYEREAPGGVGAAEGPTRWWHVFMPRKGADTHGPTQPKRDLKAIHNDECGQWSTLAETSADNVLIQNTNESKLKLIIHSQPSAHRQFINDGVKLFNSEPLAVEGMSPGVQLIEAMDINIDLAEDKSGGNDGNDDQTVVDQTMDQTVDAEAVDAASDGDKIEAVDNSATNSWFSIDTESYERQSVKITLMPKVLNMYAL